MIDFRYNTFLALAEIKNFTKTAETLHITQPAVTQHIKYLEDKYKVKLFNYINKRLELTIQGEKLRKFLMQIVADTKHFDRNLKNSDFLDESIFFGATLSIGEYIMPNIVANLLKNNPNLNIHMEVNNTESLLKKLWLGEIDFAIVEGIFDKSEYESILFSEENFIPVAAINSKLSNKEVTFKDLLSSTLVLREIGSGTREILENILHNYNYTLNSFKKVIEIGNMSAIKELVSKDTGITFLYEIVAKKELEEEKLKKIEITGVNIKREFNFIFLKNSYYKEKYIKYFQLMKNSLQ